MIQQKSRYTKARWLFLVMFLLSTCLVFVCGFLGSLTNRWMWGSTDITGVVTGGSIAIAIAACPTSILTFIGLISTTLLIWRKRPKSKRGRHVADRRALFLIALLSLPAVAYLPGGELCSSTCNGFPPRAGLAGKV